MSIVATAQEVYALSRRTRRSLHGVSRRTLGRALCFTTLAGCLLAWEHYAAFAALPATRQNHVEEQPSGILCSGLAPSKSITMTRRPPSYRAATDAASAPAPAIDDSEFVPAFSISAIFALLLAPLLLESAPLASLLEVLAVLYVMRGAANRSRLNGGTFRVLALSLVAAAFIILFDSGTQVVVALQGVAKLGLSSWSAVVPVARARVIAMVASAYALWASYTTLLRHGVPPIKTAVRCKESWILTGVAFGQAAVAAHHMVVGAMDMLYSSPSAGALRCLVSAACAHVCQTAAVVGKKRLASTTYRWLNFSLVLAGLVRLFVAYSSPSGDIRLKFEVAASTLQTVTAAYAWAVGTAAASSK
mmetsp:Transcript_66725/g.159557  ORF Transcript_66725/g.159557 Transcript_66725/m.159557 type:complete len:361 (-) Transcript_66725:101-1183(-)